MPTASDERREQMNKLFGDPISDHGPMKYLEARGYKLTPDWCWIKPSPDHEVTDEEGNCIDFLIEEWDFDGIVVSPRLTVTTLETGTLVVGQKVTWHVPRSWWRRTLDRLRHPLMMPAKTDLCESVITSVSSSGGCLHGFADWDACPVCCH